MNSLLFVASEIHVGNFGRAAGFGIVGGFVAIGGVYRALRLRRQLYITNGKFKP
jgi:hypothetical protein